MGKANWWLVVEAPLLGIFIHGMYAVLAPATPKLYRYLMIESSPGSDQLTTTEPFGELAAAVNTRF